ncbi:hypothetical protein M433DRAFT_393186 [Acidomyces richmondensis BFW]|nr:MAG: hypothetical protein FE78DRAFT_27634 [Acidomyces sp. 'richmondensis']KYG42763.1 hypothetical protein M433DRAFT_393186 [Acidomyces richmondensis BFW]
MLPRTDLTSFGHPNETALPLLAYSSAATSSISSSSATNARCSNVLSTGLICVELGTHSGGGQKSMSTSLDSAISPVISLPINNAPMIAHSAHSLLVPTKIPGPPPLNTPETQPRLPLVGSETSQTILGTTQAPVPPSAHFRPPPFSNGRSTAQKSVDAQSTSLVQAVTTLIAVDVSSALVPGVTSAAAYSSESATLKEIQSGTYSTDSCSLLSATSSHDSHLKTTSFSTVEATSTAPKSPQDTSANVATNAASSSSQISGVWTLGTLDLSLAVSVFLSLIQFT